MARLGGLEGGLGRLASRSSPIRITSGSLPQRAPKRLAEGLGVQANLTLVHDAAQVLVEELDRVLDRDDVLAPVRVDVIEDRRERRRLARPGRAGYEDEPRCSSASRRTPLGSFSVSKLGTSRGITRNAKEMAPRWRNPFTRKRVRSFEV